MFHVPEENRIAIGNLASDSSYGNNGAFEIPSINNRRILFVIAADGLKWDHVSVHAMEGGKARVPTWNEMCFIKDLFWDGEDVVIQYHPRKSDYINVSKFTLHLWRSQEIEFPAPPIIMV